MKKLIIIAILGILMSGCGAKETELDRELVQSREIQKGNENESRKLCIFSLERGENRRGKTTAALCRGTGD